MVELKVMPRTGAETEAAKQNRGLASSLSSALPKTVPSAAKEEFIKKASAILNGISGKYADKYGKFLEMASDENFSQAFGAALARELSAARKGGGYILDTLQADKVGSYASLLLGFIALKNEDCQSGWLFKSFDDEKFKETAGAFRLLWELPPRKEIDGGVFFTNKMHKTEMTFIFSVDDFEIIEKFEKDFPSAHAGWLSIK